MKGVVSGPHDPATGLRPLAAVSAAVPAEEGLDAAAAPAEGEPRPRGPVSYTHLTLPTICSV
eukprot:12126930-Alexandrium_andersonii.AAC.1